MSLYCALLTIVGSDPQCGFSELVVVNREYQKVTPARATYASPRLSLPLLAHRHPERALTLENLEMKTVTIIVRDHVHIQRHCSR